MHVIRQFLPYFDNDGYWEQFGTRSDSAIELLPCFDNDGHWSKLGTRSDPAMELLPYFDNDGHWDANLVLEETLLWNWYVILLMMVTGTKFVPHLTIPYGCDFDNDGHCHWDKSKIAKLFWLWWSLGPIWYHSWPCYRSTKPNDFHNDGHFDQFDIHTWPKFRIAKLSS